MPTDDSRPSDHEPADDHSRLDLSIHRQAVFGSEGLEVETGAVETTLTDHGIEVGHQLSTRLDVPTSGSLVDDRPQASAGSVAAGKQEPLFASSIPGQRTLDDRDASMVPRFGDRSDSRASDIVEERESMGFRSATAPVGRVTPLSAFESHLWGNYCFAAAQ